MKSLKLLEHLEQSQFDMLWQSIGHMGTMLPGEAPQQQCGEDQGLLCQENLHNRSGDNRALCQGIEPDSGSIICSSRIRSVFDFVTPLYGHQPIYESNNSLDPPFFNSRP
jgi:hypothetical protein